MIEQIFGYAIGFVLTFGHSFVNNSDPDIKIFPEQRYLDGVVAGIFWPLYWSIQIFSKIKTKNTIK